MSASQANKNSACSAEVAMTTISEMTEENRIDLGHSFVVRGSHPSLGDIVVFNSAEGNSAIIAI